MMPPKLNLTDFEATCLAVVITAIVVILVGVGYATWLYYQI